MSYTTRQVQTLLTKPELELFQASRANAVKEFSARQLVGKISRARALRDKYRDLYQRQTVRTGTGPANARKVMGGENSRTDVKADVMQEVLSRFEAQFEKVQSPNPKPAPAAKRNSPTLSRAIGSGNADIAMRGVKGTTPRQLARSKRAAEDVAAEAVKARGAKSSRAGTAAVKPAPAKAATTATKKKAAPAKKAAAAPKSAAKSVTSLVKAVRKAVAKKSAQSDSGATPAKGKRGGKTLVSGAASDLAQGAVPTSMPAAAARKNPIKAEPVNKKIHASARSRQRAHEAKRDSR